MNVARKDKTPEETINCVDKILDKFDLNVSIVDRHAVDGKWYSVTITFDKFPLIFTNGKGVTWKLALASAYGEMMERLQTGQLLEILYWQTSNVIQEPIEDLELYEIYKSVFPEITDKFTEASFISFLRNHPRMRQLRPYFSNKKGMNVLIPHNFIYALEGSNATCAGNTRDEALVQGMCEVFERHVQKKIYYGVQCSSVFPSVPLEVFAETVSYNLIQKILDQGYFVDIKDMTMGGVFPVLGILIFNKKKTRYFFSMGSDTNIDICIQRCITEMFQGHDFNFGFRDSMKSVYDYKELSLDRLSLKNIDMHYIATLKDHTGKLPPYLLLQTHITQNIDLKPFNNEIKRNGEALQYVINLLALHTPDIYILDCSYLNFPAYRIYCPEFNNVHYYNHDEFIKNLGFEDKIKVNRQNIPKVFDAEYLENVSNMGEISRNMDPLAFHKYIGITFIKPDQLTYYDSIDEFCLKLALHLGDYEIASKHLSKIRAKSVRHFGLLDAFHACIEAKKNGISDDDLKAYLLISHDEEETFQMFNRLYGLGNEKMLFPNCPNCTNCDLKSYCCKERWDIVMAKLKQAKERFGLRYI